MSEGPSLFSSALVDRIDGAEIWGNEVASDGDVDTERLGKRVDRLTAIERLLSSGQPETIMCQLVGARRAVPRDNII